MPINDTKQKYQIRYIIDDRDTARREILITPGSYLTDLDIQYNVELEFERGGKSVMCYSVSVTEEDAVMLKLILPPVTIIKI